jgi:hypothetical protein
VMSPKPFVEVGPVVDDEVRVLLFDALCVP